MPPLPPPVARAITAIAAGAALASLGACGTAGAFRQATMFHECAATDDGCARLTPTAPIAVGASLRTAVSVSIAGTTTPLLGLTSGKPDIVTIDGDRLVGVAPGLAPILITGDDGSVIDFVHVWVATPTRLVVLRKTAGAPDEEITAPVQLVAGEQLALAPAIYGGAQRLAGDVEIEWTATCDAAACGEPVALLRDGSGDRRRLVARAPGKVTVHARALGLDTTLDVEVMP